MHQAVEQITFNQKFNQVYISFEYIVWKGLHCFAVVIIPQKLPLEIIPQNNYKNSLKGLRFQLL